MYWIVQDNLHEEHGHIALMDTLERFSIPHTVVKVLPFSDHLPTEERMIPFVKPTGNVMVCGSISLAKLATAMGWIPGSFHNENHDYRVWKQYYGNHLLNAEAVVCKYGEVEHKWDKFFIRPVEDTKTFSGMICDWVEFKDWQHRVLDLKESYTTLNSDTVVMMSPLKKIYREARFFVVDGKVVTGSTYKIGSRVHPTAEVPPTMWEYAERMVNIWCPARSFVIDIALTDDADDGYNKVIEINCVNSSGFYDCDMQKFVFAIEEMQF